MTSRFVDGDVESGRGSADRRAAPRLSVVVASFREERLLAACLESLRAQCEEWNAELIVARAGAADEVELLAGRMAVGRFVACAPDTKIPQLRAAGMRASRGDIVAVTEDHCVASPDWLAQLAGGNRPHADVVGGAMRNAQHRRSIDWGAYFAEYGFFADAPSAEHPIITAANVAYSRAAVEEAATLGEGGAWENVVHARLAEQGRTMRFVKTAIIAQNKNYRFRSFCRDRFEHGRDYAQVRLREEGATHRWLYLMGAAVLPFLLTFRVARLNAKREPRGFVRALPFTFAFLCMWSVGELAGYWRGPSSLQETHG